MSANVRFQGVALLVAQGWTVRAAARKCGVDERTVRRWQAGDDFGRRVTAFRQEITERALGIITAAMTGASRELRRLLKSPDGRLRLAASKAILEQQGRLTALTDLAGRVATLEAASLLPTTPPRQ